MDVTLLVLSEGDDRHVRASHEHGVLRLDAEGVTLLSSAHKGQHTSEEISINIIKHLD